MTFAAIDIRVGRGQHNPFRAQVGNNFAHSSRVANIHIARAETNHFVTSPLAHERLPENPEAPMTATFIVVISLGYSNVSALRKVAPHSSSAEMMGSPCSSE